MKIGGMGGIELVIILVVILLIFGPKNLPKLGSAIGKTVCNLRAGMNEGKKKEVDQAEATEDAPAPAAAAELEGEVEEVIDEVAEVESDLAEAANQAVEDAAAAADEAFGDAPKKVRRVVRKKVNSD